MKLLVCAYTVFLKYSSNIPQSAQLESACTTDGAQYDGIMVYEIPS